VKLFELREASKSSACCAWVAWDNEDETSWMWSLQTVCRQPLNRLIDWCFTAPQHKIGQFVPIYQGGLLAQPFEDSQRGTYKNTQLHVIQWTYTCNDKQQVCLTCLKIIIVSSVGAVGGWRTRAIDCLRKASRRWWSVAEVSLHQADEAYDNLAMTVVMKQTIKYYVNRWNHVFACFMDFSSS